MTRPILLTGPTSRLRTMAGCAAIALCLASAVQAAPPRAARPAAAQPPVAQDEWSSEVVVLQTSTDPDNPGSFSPGGIWRREWNDWFGPADMPADLRRRELDTVSLVALDVGVDGKVEGCRVVGPSEDVRLDRAACRILTERGRFPISYEGPARPARAKRVMAIKWETISAEARAARNRMPTMAPVPPPPPPPASRNAWPRLFHPGGLTPVSLPGIQSDYPVNAGRPKEGTVSLDLRVSGPGGIIGCEIGVGSGNKALDEAACRVARRLDLRYASPCEACGEERLPLQVVWRKRGSHIRLPLATPYRDPGPPIPRDPADSRTASAYRIIPRLLAPDLSPADFASLPDKSHGVRIVQARVSVDSNGRATDCAIRTSSGNAAIDQRICELLVKRGRFLPRTDVFGDPVPSGVPLSIDLGVLL